MKKSKTLQEQILSYLRKRKTPADVYTIHERVDGHGDPDGRTGRALRHLKFKGQVSAMKTKEGLTGYVI